VRRGFGVLDRARANLLPTRQSFPELRGRAMFMNSVSGINRGVPLTSREVKVYGFGLVFLEAMRAGKPGTIENYHSASSWIFRT
jgi:glycosyltransferase involved in cell wall biosynthesis